MILVVHKRSSWSQRTDKEQRLLDIGDSTVARMVDAHEAHEACIEATVEYLEKRGCAFNLTHEVSEELVQTAELVVTLDGDGTLLHVSHFVGSTPVLPINSAPEHSVGYFCSKMSNLDLLDQAACKELPVSRVARMSVSVGDDVVTTRALNDALFCHTNPAMMTRYFLESDKAAEEQMSSGVWVSTAAGSTAAIRSAGGFTMPHDSMNIQFLVREPYQPSGRRLQNIHGFVKPGEAIAIKSKIEEGCVWVDGSHVTHFVTRGETLRVQSSPEPLNLLSFRKIVGSPLLPPPSRNQR